MDLCRAESKGRCLLQEFDLTQQFTVNCLCHKLSQLWVLSKNIGEDEHCLLEYFSDNSIKCFVGSILLQKSTLSLLALCSKSVVMLVGILSKDMVRLPNILNWTLLLCFGSNGLKTIMMQIKSLNFSRMHWIFFEIIKTQNIPSIPNMLGNLTSSFRWQPLTFFSSFRLNFGHWPPSKLIVSLQQYLVFGIRLQFS